MPNELRRVLDCGFDEALAKVPSALQSEGFGVLTEIDVQETLRKKLGIEFRRYKILGACNPPLAHRALQTELEVGLLLPCNVVVYEDDAGKVVISAVDPAQTLGVAGHNVELASLAREVREKLARALEQVR